MILYRYNENKYAFPEQYIDEEAGYVIDFDEGKECCDFVEIQFIDSKQDRIEKLEDWTFIETPDLLADGEFYIDEIRIKIKNTKTGEIGNCVISGENSGYYSATFSCKKTLPEDK